MQSMFMPPSKSAQSGRNFETTESESGEEKGTRPQTEMSLHHSHEPAWQLK